MIWFLPIEPLAARYTQQMLSWVNEDLRQYVGVDGFDVLLPDYKGGIKHGQFLDSFASARFKAEQLRMVAELFQNDQVDSGDLFLLGDVWFPGAESIRMMAELQGCEVKIAGWHYAGTFDASDYYSRTLGAWARRFEQMLCENVLDAMCVGSQYHANLLHRNMDKLAIYPYGLSWKPDMLPQIDAARDNIVVFPHRIAPEKNVPAFLRSARRLKDSGWRFVISVPREQEDAARAAAAASLNVEVRAHDSKLSYYQLLAGSRIVYSAAHQETFGYSVNEAIAFGCAVVAPDRLSYSEVLEHDRKFLYGDDDPDGALLLECRMKQWLPVPMRYTEKYADSTEKFLREIYPP